MISREKFDFAISSFSVLENQLTDCMAYLPFIDENKQAVSPKFVPIIMDACGLVDSIFFEISSDNKSNEHFNLKKYSKIHESSLKLDNNATLFLASPIRLLQPYCRVS